MKPFIQIAHDFSALEYHVTANCLRENDKAKRKPARLRKKLYGKHKLPFSFIHDCKEIHDKDIFQGLNYVTRWYL